MAVSGLRSTLLAVGKVLAKPEKSMYSLLDVGKVLAKPEKTIYSLLAVG